jgi:hypothetical protein
MRSPVGGVRVTGYDADLHLLRTGAVDQLAGGLEGFLVSPRRHSSIGHTRNIPVPDHVLRVRRKWT